MASVLLLSVGVLLPSNASAIHPSDAINHVGQEVVVSGLVADVSVSIFLNKMGNVFIDFGDKYPDQTLSAWIPAGCLLAQDPWIMSLRGKTIQVRGTVEIYKGKPEIKVLSRDEITNTSF
jgi:hypothetical protein